MHQKCRSSIVHCLSNIRFQATVLDERSVDLADKCSHQLQKAYLDTERVEATANVQLFRQCKVDIQNLKCYGGEKTAEDVIECLRQQAHNIENQK